jgi:hypothetical protein
MTVGIRSPLSLGVHRPLGRRNESASERSWVLVRSGASPDARRDSRLHTWPGCPSACSLEASRHTEASTYRWLGLLLVKAFCVDIDSDQVPRQLRAQHSMQAGPEPDGSAQGPPGTLLTTTVVPVGSPAEEGRRSRGRGSVSGLQLHESRERRREEPVHEVRGFWRDGGAAMGRPVGEQVAIGMARGPAPEIRCDVPQSVLGGTSVETAASTTSASSWYVARINAVSRSSRLVK